MKNNSLAIVILGMITATFIFISCNRSTENENIEREKINSSILSATVCCGAECKGGKCWSYSSPCECTCTYTGAPKCNGGGSSNISDIKAGDVRIEAQQQHLDYYQNVINRLNQSNNNYASAVQTQIQEMYNLYVNNNNELTTTPALQSFYTHDSVATAYLNLYFTEQEIDELFQ
jgi:hypothetical protein